MVTSIKYLTGLGANTRHFHDSHQLLFITNGEASIKIQDTTIRAVKGQIILLSRFEKHSVTPATESFCRYVLRLSPSESSDELLYILFSNRPKGFEYLIDTGDDFDIFCFLLQKLTFEFENDKSMKKELIDSITKQILIYIYRKLPQLSYKAQDENFAIITKLQKTFETNFDKDFSLNQIASQNGMSVSYLSHTFKKITGTSVIGYLFKCRINEAKRLLTHTNLSIGEIVERCGFSDSSNFSRTFKSLTKLSPSEFRKKYSI